MLVKVANKDTESVVSVLIKQSQRLPSEPYRFLTWDRGKELADHQRLTLATEIDVYFCDPRSPWQRGSSENTNRLLRQYLPRGTDLSCQAKLSAIARQLNEKTPKDLAISNPSRQVRRMYCSDQLNPPRKANTQLNDEVSEVPYVDHSNDFRVFFATSIKARSFGARDARFG
jgi:hypothetical protein